MARPRGVRNPDFAHKRSALLDKLTDFALNTDLQRASLRQFASAAGVSEPTLRHYFTDRTGVVREIMERIAERGAPFIAHAAEPHDDYASSLKAYMDLSLAGVLHSGFARAHAFGLIEGVADPELGRAYLTTLLEPSLQAIETKLKPFLSPEEASSPRLRAAALSVFAPMLLAVLHQRVLGGDGERPLDMPAFFDVLCEAVERGYPEADSAGSASND